VTTEVTLTYKCHNTCNACEK